MILPHVIIEVDHTNKVTQLIASFWDCKGLNGLEIIWYLHNPVMSDMITQMVNFVGAKALFSGIALEAILLEAGEHIFNDSRTSPIGKDFAQMF